MRVVFGALRRRREARRVKFPFPVPRRLEMKRLLLPLSTKASLPTKATLPLLLLLASLAFGAHAYARPRFAQRRPAAAARGFAGDWNWAVYAKSRSELPPAYRNMSVREVPAYALDVTIKQRGKRLSATCGVVARYLARVDDCSFDEATVKNGSAVVKLTSSFGGTATVRLTLKGNRLRWQVVEGSGEFYFPRDVTLRRLRRGEKLPYAADEDEH